DIYVTSYNNCDFYYCNLLFLFLTSAPTTKFSTLSLHDALPICPSWGPWLPAPPSRQRRIRCRRRISPRRPAQFRTSRSVRRCRRDRKSTRLNSSHVSISYAVFCLKKKNKCNMDYINTINYVELI